MTHEKGTIGGDWGVFVYCNRRLIIKSLRTSEVGFISGLVGIPHWEMSLARIIVNISGLPDGMPWNSNKTGIYYNHQTFSLLREMLIKIVKNAVDLSKIFIKDFDTKVEPFKTGDIVEIKLGVTEGIKPRKLLTPPKTRESYKTVMQRLNKPLGSLKP